ncbi:MAG: DUF465 domain-containing protein [Gammaproteobacteria bacterium]|nr:DUF465 domain-containing protein [Gammaproteobacteria bacterium]
MFGESHDLPHEFPEHIQRIHELKERNPDFAKLFNEYHSVDREVRRIEQNLETVSDAYAEDLKKRRLMLKDRLYAMIQDPSL